MAKVWKDEKSCYHDQGRKCYRAGDVIPDEIVAAMGKQTVEELEKRGMLGDIETQADVQEKKRLELLEKAKELGLNPRPNTGIEKLEAAIADAEAGGSDGNSD